MTWAEDDFLQLSGLQHFAFCRRQWALIHIENQWAEDYRTMDGHFMHERVHDQQFRESRGERITVRGLAVHSARLGVSGQCDAVEFFKDPAGVTLRAQEGLWLPYPVEYKRGEDQRSIPPMSCSFALRQCALRRCFAAQSRRERYIMASRAGGLWSALRQSCVPRWKTALLRCMSCIKNATRLKSSPIRAATPVR